jgi:hypothetical protein
VTDFQDFERMVSERSRKLGARNGSAFETTYSSSFSGWWLVAIGAAVVLAALALGRL